MKFPLLPLQQIPNSIKIPIPIDFQTYLSFISIIYQLTLFIWNQYFKYSFSNLLFHHTTPKNYPIQGNSSLKSFFIIEFFPRSMNHEIKHILHNIFAVKVFSLFLPFTYFHHFQSSRLCKKTHFYNFARLNSKLPQNQTKSKVRMMNQMHEPVGNLVRNSKNDLEKLNFDAEQYTQSKLMFQGIVKEGKEGRKKGREIILNLIFAIPMGWFLKKFEGLRMQTIKIHNLNLKASKRRNSQDKYSSQNRKTLPKNTPK